MLIELSGISLHLELSALASGQWIPLPLDGSGSFSLLPAKMSGSLQLLQRRDRVEYRLEFQSSVFTRLRLCVRWPDAAEPFHLIPGNIHGDNNAAHVRPGEFPCLTNARPADRSCASLWEFRADRASHPVSILCSKSGAIGISVDPYSDCEAADDGFIRNGILAALPDTVGVSLGYGNDPLSFIEKTRFAAATADLTRGASARGTIFAVTGHDRSAAHSIIRSVYEQMHERPVHERSHREALHALGKSFVEVNWSPQLQQYTNRSCRPPQDTALRPWRAIVEIGWTGGSMLAYPFLLAQTICRDLHFPKPPEQIFDEIVSGWNPASGFINDTALNRFTRNLPAGWNDSQINGWWSTFLPNTAGNHCAYTNGHAAYYLLKASSLNSNAPHHQRSRWRSTSLQILHTAIQLQRDDGAFGYIFSSTRPEVVDWDGFAGCWFAAALALAWRATGEERYRQSADRALEYYFPFVRQLTCFGSPMDTYKSIDSEGNLAFVRAARLMHQFTGEQRYLAMLLAGAHYEYLWRYGFRTRPQCPPLRGSPWNSCGGSLTSVSNPHVHPMSVVITQDLLYLAPHTGDAYHQSRAQDGLAWLMNTMELYPGVMDYGQYGVLSERTCPSDGLLAERYADTGLPSSTWWTYNAWAAGSAMEALAEHILASEPSEPTERLR